MNLSAESRRVVILGLIACVLGGYTYLTASDIRPSSQQARAHKEHPVLNFAPQDVSQITLVSNTQRLTCQRTAEGWQQTPSGLPIPTYAIDDFLSNLGKLLHLGDVEGMQTGPAQTEIAQYGLQPPQTSIHLQLKGQETRSLTIGTRNPVQSSLYAQVNTAPQVILVGAVIAWDIRKVFIAASQSGA
jgi:hypothetical protein